MAARGRKSAASLEIITTVADAAPDAPYDLTDEAASVWRGVLDSLPAGYVAGEQFDTLAAYCRHVVSARFLSREIDRFKLEWLKVEDGPDRLNKLLAMRDREVRGVLATARALRLTNQSRYRPERAATARGASAAGSAKPWEPIDD
jgi:hypothetical protein